MQSTWEKQPDEKTHIYEAARIYFEMGPGRSLQAVAAQCRRHPSTVARWSTRHGWAARARAYDSYRLKAEDDERRRWLAEADRTEAQRWRERLQSKREEEWETSQALIAKAREMLACSLEDTKWNWRDAAALINQAAQLVRMAAGEAEQAEESSGTERALLVRVEYVAEEPHREEGK